MKEHAGFKARPFVLFSRFIVITSSRISNRAYLSSRVGDADLLTSNMKAALYGVEKGIQYSHGRAIESWRARVRFPMRNSQELGGPSPANVKHSHTVYGTPLLLFLLALLGIAAKLVL